MGPRVGVVIQDLGGMKESEDLAEPLGTRDLDLEYDDYKFFN
jgi:hypothetical protein